VPAVATGPIMAKIADIYGRRWIIIISYALFAVGAVSAALRPIRGSDLTLTVLAHFQIVAMTAKTINGVLAGQVISGVAAGSAGLINAIASEVMPGLYRTWAQSALNW
jgi:MFS family permease